MTRQGLPTGQMQEETKELLDEYNETYCWEYNDMVDFIKEYIMLIKCPEQVMQSSIII